MRPTFMGLETSKRGLFTQQSALYTTGHNISNANTEGYTRQRVDMKTTLPYPGTGVDQPKTTGYVGTGVQGDSVQRIRDAFTDNQYRQETMKLGYWEARSQAITEVEDVLNEPSEYGLSKALDDFWNSLQDLSVNPENGGARKVVVQRALAVAESFSYMHKSITQIQDNAAMDISVNLKDVNSVIRQIADINHQIQKIEPNGYMPNDLYDARDVLLDQLSEHFPIETENFPTGGNALAIAEGSMAVSLRLKDGSKLKLIDGDQYVQLRTYGSNVASDKMTPTGPVEGLYIVKVDDNGNDVNIDNSWDSVLDPVKQEIMNFSNTGKFKSLVNSYGYLDNTINPTSEKGFYPEMLQKLDVMAQSFADEFNKMHMGGAVDPDNPPNIILDPINYPAGSDIYGKSGGAFFVNRDSNLYPTTGITAGNIYVSQDIINDPGKIVASNSTPNDTTPNPEPGNGKFALKLAGMKFSSLPALGDVSVQTYFEGVIGQLGVDGQQAERFRYNTETLKQAVTERRASVSSVSLDEEMTNMVKFQQAYNANARMISVIDEMLDKIINGMGRAGL